MPAGEGTDPESARHPPGPSGLDPGRPLSFSIGCARYRCTQRSRRCSASCVRMLSAEPWGRGNPRLQHIDRQVSKKGREGKLCRLRAKLLKAVSAEIDCTIKGIGAWPGAADVGRAGEMPRCSDDGCISAAAARKGNDMIAVRPAHLQRLIIAFRKHVSEFSPNFKEMRRPRELELTI